MSLAVKLIILIANEESNCLSSFVILIMPLITMLIKEVPELECRPIVPTNDPGLCVSVSARPRLRSIENWYRCAKVRLSPWSRVARSILAVRMSNSQKFVGPKTNLKIMRPLLDCKLSEFGNSQIFRK